MSHVDVAVTKHGSGDRRKSDAPASRHESEVARMLESASTHAMIAVGDLDVAKEFYGGKLGLTASDERPGGVRYETAAATWFFVYLSGFAGTAKTTHMRFEVEDIEVTVADLRARGVVFEEYDLPGVKTVDGIADHESGARGAWFRDPDGNILEIGQRGN
jgi:catechol 2,3-dioxygenase-like lactoylglutathione lyase family enzyme